MANLHALKSRIDSIEKTASITKAMYRIASSKLVSSQDNYRKYQIFKDAFDTVLESTLKAYDVHPYMGHEKPSKHKLYVLISADRGLVGSYHLNLFKGFLELIKDEDKDNVHVVAVGKKAFSFAAKHNLKVVNEKIISNPDQISEHIFQEYISVVIERFLSNKISQVIVYSNHFINSMKQEPKAEVLLPIDRIRQSDENDFMLFEGNKMDILDQLIHVHLQSRIYGLLIDAKLSEFSSRILAMKSATDNASEALSQLSLKYHQARQSKITADLLDISNAKL